MSDLVLFHICEHRAFSVGLVGRRVVSSTNLVTVILCNEKSSPPCETDDLLHRLSVPTHGEPSSSDMSGIIGYFVNLEPMRSLTHQRLRARASLYNVCAFRRALVLPPAGLRAPVCLALHEGPSSRLGIRKPTSCRVCKVPSICFRKTLSLFAPAEDQSACV